MARPENYDLSEDPYDPKHAAKYRTPSIGDRIDAIDPEEYMRGFEDGRRDGLRQNVSICAEHLGIYRIEALRAAAQVTGAIGAGLVALPNTESLDVDYLAKCTLRQAKQFAAWLEGE